MFCHEAMDHLLLLTLFTGYAEVAFDIEFVWTNTLQEHNLNGTLNSFLKQQVESLVSGKAGTH